jgi:GLPGLI family protein
MKKINLLLFSLLFTTILSAQNTLQGKVFYTISFKSFTEQQVDSILEKGNRPKSTQPFIRKMLMNSKDVTGILEFSKNESLYQVENKMRNGAKKGLNMTLMAAGSNNIYYINSIKKDYYKQLNYAEPLRIDLSATKWSITQETKNIGSYQCFKAISVKRMRKNKPAVTTIAWFTPVIPVSFGPINCFGLPGLILEVSYMRTTIKATKIVLNPKEKIAIKKPTEGKRMTKDEYEEMSRNFFKGLGRKKR